MPDIFAFLRFKSMLYLYELQERVECGDLSACKSVCCLDNYLWNLYREVETYRWFIPNYED